MQARASRLSFNDIVKGLAATEETRPTFISKKVKPLPCDRAAYACTRIFSALQLHLLCTTDWPREMNGFVGKEWSSSSGHRMGGDTSLVMHAQHHISPVPLAAVYG